MKLTEIIDKNSNTKFIFGKPESAKDFELYLQYIFDKAQTYAKNNQEVSLTPQTVHSKNNLIYGFMLDEEKQKTFYGIDLQNFEDEDFFLRLIEESGEFYSKLASNGVSIKLNFGIEHIFDYFFNLFYIDNEYNLFVDSYTNTLSYHLKAPGLTTYGRIENLLETFEKKTASSQESEILLDLDERYKKQLKNFDKVKYPDKVFLTAAVNDYESVVSLIVQLSDINLEKICRQIFVTETFKGIEEGFIQGVLDEIFLRLNEMEVETYVSESLIDSYPYVYKLEPMEIKIDKTIPKDLGFFLKPRYRVDVSEISADILYSGESEDDFDEK
ncbi:MAG: hypothetical protein PWP03_167 [Candidatus Woesearchaeota archaeon]|nr:hypothetical protein [Candidatus Woesearchaeota archaeon]MDN5327529.1 hypothetical protein [Candidatus Woesearchaeota archaeon]